jgi:ABC-type protease/lipase transport system fused ATPase/permease subunit
MNEQFKITPCSQPLEDWVERRRAKEDEERRKDEPENRIEEIKEGLRYLEAMGMMQEVDEIWFEFYYGARK